MKLWKIGTRWAFLERNRIGATNHWQFRLTLTCPEGSLKPKQRADIGCVGVDVGWRITNNGLRVACWSGSDGHEGELVISRERIEQMRYSDTLRATRDANFNEIRESLAAWVCDRDVPEWLREQTKTITQWKSQGRLAVVVMNWRDSRFDGDTAMFEMLEAWRKQDKHLWNWEGHGRSTAWRKEMYRNFATGSGHECRQKPAIKS